MASDLNIELFKQSDSGDRLLGAWQQILGGLESYRFFHHPAWFQAINNHLLGQQIQYVLLSDSKGPLAVLPFVVEKHLLGRSVLLTPSHDHITLNDWIIRHDADMLLILSALPSIADTVKEQGWNRLFLSSLPDSSALIDNGNSALFGQTSISGFKSNLQKVRQSAWFDPASIDDHLGKKMKKNLRSRRRKAEAIGNIVCNISETKPDRLADYDRFLEVEASGWKGAEGSSTAIGQNKQLRAFYQELVSTELPGIHPRINTLTIGDSMAAAQFAISTPGCHSILKIGFQESLSDCAPGSILLEHILDHYSQNSDDGIISLVTSPEWAKRWHPNQQDVYNYTLYNSDMFGTIAACKDSLIDGARQLKSTRQQAA